ncbi:hypothetical protein ACPPVU_00825 [Mucilaginibacter sp. McL0603]|uniref:hypothetical protein n=1 Tax=Mucilaginibacter sp. McL0603 TaxID=3415670 RepID=UPI003CF585F8
MKLLFPRLVLIVLSLTAYKGTYAQDVSGAVIFHIQSSHTSFPDTGRVNGHTYDKVLYTAAEHYHDSTVLIIAPKNLDVKEKVDLIFWFHGWHNSVDNAASYYDLTKQFIASKRNAVLILAETAKDSPDSYGGKLENPGVFKALVADVMTGLKSQHLITADCVPGHIMLAGHSGAYRVMARIIKNGQMPIDETILFDALYAETEIFMDWIKTDQSHRFIDLYTDHGGTDGESHTMLKLLAQDQIPYLETEEVNVTPQLLNSNRLIYIHSAREHNDIINKPDNFRLFLENNPFLRSLK